MEDDYLKLSQFPYNSHPFPYNSYQSPLGTTGFLTEDLAWERFTTMVTDVDVSAYYNMSLRDFEHSGVHDLFEVS